jgi:hypothetical protein
VEPDQFKILFDAIQDGNKKVDNLHGDFREFKGVMTTKVKQLETDAQNDRFWGNVKTLVVIPVVAGLHQIASYIGWIK